MNGYVINKSPLWAHAMKREIRPNGKIDINDLYEQYGEKHNLAEGDEFINWLKNVKLKGGRWSIILDDTPNAGVDKSEKSTENSNVTPIVKDKMEIEDIVNLTVRKAREVIPEMSDLKTLRIALRDASKMANRDSLCRILRKRVQELEQYS